MKQSTIAKAGSIFLSVIAVGLLFGCLFSYWRNLYGLPDTVTKKYGMYRNCKDFVAVVKDVCVWPQNEGFVGDFAILLMLIISLLIFVIHIAFMCLALSTLQFFEILLYLLPVPSIIANSLLITCGTVFSYYINTAYIDDIVFQSPFKITYGEGLYVLIVAFGFGTLATAFAIAGAFLISEELEEIKAQKTGYVVQQKVVKKQVIETPEVEYEEVEEVQQQQVAEEDLDVESAKIVQKPVKKAKKVQKPPRKSKPSINAPVKKKKKIQSGFQQSEVVKGDDESKKSKSEKPLSSLKSVSGMEVKDRSDRSRGKKKRTNVEESE